MYKKFIYKDYDLGKEVADGVKELCNFLKERGVRRIIDYGCGNGRNSIYLAENGFYVTAVDYAPFIQDLAELVKKKKLQLKVQELDKDKTVLPFDSDYFDGILAWRILHRGLYNERMKILKELNRILKKGGYFLCSVSSDRDIKLDVKRRLHKEIEKQTFKYESKGEINIRHYFSLNEIKSGKAFPGFKILAIDELKEKTGHKDRDYLRHYWRIFAQKK